MWLPMHGLLYMVRSGRSRRPMHRSICSCSVLHLGRRHESGKTLGFPAFGFVSLCVWEIEIDVFEVLQGIMVSWVRCILEIRENATKAGNKSQ